ncbi:hypothetical protein SAMN02745866_01151 [Alteromonadaceae bacterium Bs31]|nr:hypothetical protein SAMN02745866_01151 [Alteromonadaceae bacterium Bs31]
MKHVILPFTLLLTVFALAGCDQKQKTEETAEAPEAAVEAMEQAVSDAAPAEQEKPSMVFSQTKSMTAKVVEVDQESRVVTLEGENGNLVTFVASEDVRNLAQVEAGDLLTIEAVENVVIELVDGEGMEAGVGEVVASARAEEGEKPGAAMMSKSVEVFMVEEINLENNTYKLKNVDGMVEEFVARNPENLKLGKVGDSVVVTVTEALAIAVTELPQE